MLRIQENVYMMDEEGNKFMKLMDAEECIACYWVRAVIGLKDGMDQVVGNYFFSRLEDAEDKMRMIRREEYFINEEGEDVLFGDEEKWGNASAWIKPIRAMR